MKRMAIFAAALTACALMFTGCSKPAPKTPGEEAQAAAQEFLDSCTTLDVQKAYEMLPSSTRGKITAAVAPYVQAIDAECWNAAAGLLSDVADVVGAQADNLVALAKQYGGDYVENIDSVKASDIKNLGVVLKAIGSLDRQKIIAGDYSALLGSKGVKELMKFIQGQAEFQEAVADELGATFKLVSENEDGTVTLVEVKANGEEGQEMLMKKMDGVWVIADFIKGIEEGLAEMGNDVSADFVMADMFSPENKAEILTAIGAIRGVLPSLKNARSPEELTGAAMAGFMQLGSLFDGDI